MSRKPSSLDDEIARWRQRALSAERALEAASVEIAESFRASRARADHEQRIAQQRQRRGDQT